MDSQPSASGPSTDCLYWHYHRPCRAPERAERSAAHRLQHRPATLGSGAGGHSSGSGCGSEWQHTESRVAPSQCGLTNSSNDLPG